MPNRYVSLTPELDAFINELAEAGEVVVHHIRHGRGKPPRPDEIRSK